MKKLISLFLLIVGLLYLTPVPPLRAQPTPHSLQASQAETVYITKTGKRYHRAGCRYLSHSSIKTTVKEAKANGYTPCKVCHPPE
jgi:hypothetical protein